MLTRSWRPVVCENHPSLLHFPRYRISKHTAEIRSLRTNKIIRPYYRDNDAARLSLYHNGRRKNILVHRAYLLVFHGPPPTDSLGRAFTCDHLNGNHLDNTPSNLRWLSIVEQNKRRKNTGRSAHYVQHFTLDPDDEVRRFPSVRGVWEFTRSGKVLYNGKLRVGALPGRDGYYRVHIDGRSLFVHRVIAHLFLGYDLDDTHTVIMHINHDKSDSRVDNLRIGTQRENMRAEAARRLTCGAPPCI